MVEAIQIVKALPELKKADKLLDKYLKEKSRPLGKFKPGNYFNNTKTEYMNVQMKELIALERLLKKQKDEKYFKKFLDLLWNSNNFSKMIIAARLYEFTNLNFNDFKKIIKKIDNWAHCDVFCSKVSGPYFYKNPKELKKLIPLAKSKNPWARRFATVSLMINLRKEDGEHVQSLKILDMLMADTAQKEVMAATDWMIREHLRKNYNSGFKYMKKWLDYYVKTGDRNVRWVLVRARHKLKEKDKKLMDKILEVKGK